VAHLLKTRPIYKQGDGVESDYTWIFQVVLIKSNPVAHIPNRPSNLSKKNNMEVFTLGQMHLKPSHSLPK
jgi:hypothetical protein